MSGRPSPPRACGTPGPLPLCGARPARHQRKRGRRGAADRRAGGPVPVLRKTAGARRFLTSTAGLDAIIALSAAARLDPGVGRYRRDAVRRLARPVRGLPEGGRRPFAMDPGRPRPAADLSSTTSATPLFRSLKAMAREGIAALAFIPILGGGRLRASSWPITTGRMTSPPEIDAALSPGRLDSASGRGRIGAERASPPARLDREILGRCDRQQGSRRDHPTWNRAPSGCSATAPRRPSAGPYHPVPARPRGRGAGNSRAHPRGERIDHYETVRRRKDGSMLDISLTVSPMRDTRAGSSAPPRSPATSPSERSPNASSARASIASGTARGDTRRDLHDRRGGPDHLLQRSRGRACRPHAHARQRRMVGDLEAVPAGRHAAAARRVPDGRRAEGRARRPQRRGGRRAAGWDPGAVHSLPDAVARRVGKVVGAINMLVDVSERKQAETQQRILLDELNHRVKNNMQMLQSLLFSAAQQTANGRRGGCWTKPAPGSPPWRRRSACSTAAATRPGSRREFLAAVCESARQLLPRMRDLKRRRARRALQRRGDAAGADPQRAADQCGEARHQICEKGCQGRLKGEGRTAGALRRGRGAGVRPESGTPDRVRAAARGRPRPTAARETRSRNPSRASLKVPAAENLDRDIDVASSERRAFTPPSVPDRNAAAG